MTDQELESAFEEAQDKWLAANSGVGDSTIQHRYFFLAGAEFGAKAVREMHDEAYGEKAGAQ